MKLALVFKNSVDKGDCCNGERWWGGFDILYFAMALNELHTSQIFDTTNCYTQRSESDLLNQRYKSVIFQIGGT